jgi:hypothetical protein
MTKYRAIALAASMFTLAACNPGEPTPRPVDGPTEIASIVVAAPAPSIAAGFEVRGSSLAVVRLYHVPAAHAATAASDIDSARGALGRWAAGSRVGWGYADLGEWRRAALRADMSAQAGDLIILAIDPASGIGGSLFEWRGVTLSAGE